MFKRISLVCVIVAAAALAIGCAQSDMGITTKVKTKLMADSTVKSTEIKVETKDKVVTLSGEVDNQAAKDQAVALARGTEGVSDVVDNISVKAPATASAGTTLGEKIDDAAITAAVKSKLLADSLVGGLKIDVDTRDGVVSLTGSVKSQADKDQALRLARETSGVKDVQDNLVVKTG